MEEQHDKGVGHLVGLFAVYFLLCGLLCEQHVQQERHDDHHLQCHLVSTLGTGLFSLLGGGCGCAAWAAHTAGQTNIVQPARMP